MPIQRVARLLPTDWLRTIDDRQWELLFFLLLFGYALLLIIEASSYSPDARLFPVMVGVSLVVMLVAKIGTLLFADRLSVSGGGVIGSIDIDQADEPSTTNEESKFGTLERYRREYEMVGWTFILISLIWLIGFRLSMFVIIPAFIYRYEQNRLRAVSVTVFTLIVTDLIFIRLLSVSLWEGVIVPDWIIQLLP